MVLDSGASATCTISHANALPFLPARNATSKSQHDNTLELSHNCTLKLCSAAVKQPVHDCMHQTRLDAEVLTQGWPLEPLHPRSLICHDRACRVQSPRCDHQAFAFGASMCSTSAQTETADQDETATICRDHQATSHAQGYQPSMFQQ